MPKGVLYKKFKQLLPEGAKLTRFEAFNDLLVARLIYPDSISFKEIDAIRKQFEEDTKASLGVAALAYSADLDPRVVETIRTLVVDITPLRGVFLKDGILTIRTSNVQQIYGRRNSIYERLQLTFPDYAINVEASLGEDTSKRYGEILVKQKIAISQAGVRGKVLRQLPEDMLAYAVDADAGLGELCIKYEQPKFPTSRFAGIEKNLAPLLTSERREDEDPWELNFLYQPRYAKWIGEIRAKLPKAFSKAHVGWFPIGQYLRIEIVSRDVEDVDRLEAFADSVADEFPVPVETLVRLTNVQQGAFVRSLIPPSWGLKQLLICIGRVALLDCDSAPERSSDVFKEVAELVYRKQGLTIEFGASPWEVVEDDETLNLIRDYLARPSDLVEARRHRWRPDIKLTLREVPKGVVFAGLDDALFVQHISLAKLKVKTKDPNRRGVLTKLGDSTITPKVTPRRLQGQFELTGFGGCKKIGKSCFLLRVSGVNILLDCGLSVLEQGHPDIPQDVIRQLDFVFLTHAHVDHSGMIPWLVRMGCRAKILATEPTFALSKLLQEDTLVVQRARRQRHYFDKDNIFAALAQSAVVDFFTPYKLSETVTLTPLPAGHLLGAAMAWVEDRGKSFLYTGDFSCTELRTIKPAAFPSSVDYLLMEGTYGRSNHRPRPHLEAEFQQAVEAPLQQGGTVIIPTFGVGRSAEVLSLLSTLPSLRGSGKQFDVYIDGMITKVMKTYADYIHDQEGHHLKTMDIEAQRDIFARDGRWFRGVSDRVKLCADKTPKVVLTTSGMAEGPALSYLEAFGGDESNRLVLTGYQHPSSVGGRLVSGQRDIHTDNARIRVRMDVQRFGLSAHLDREEACAVVKKLQPEFVGLVHGDPEALDMLSGELEDRNAAPWIEIVEKQTPYLLQEAQR